MILATTESLFTSLSAMRAQHRELQKEYRTHGNDPALLEQIEEFIVRGRNTGAILDEEDDQAAAQSLLDLWGNTLYRAGRPVPETNLLPFDKRQAPTLDDQPVPYVGPDAFEESKRGFFFGRETAIASMVKRLGVRRLLAISGPSGSGKSSLVLAGIVPALKSGALPGSAEWHYLGRMVPGSDPFKNLSRLLSRAQGNGSGSNDTLVDQLKKSPESLRETITSYCKGTAVLVIDQFEELSTLCEDNTAREAFEKAMVDFIGDGKTGHVLILTMRSDFISAVARQPEFQKLLETALVPITPLLAPELREAITRPAESIGLKFEPGVVDSLVHDTLGEPAALPLLQFTLLKLWEQRDHNQITLKAYRELGGGRLALTRSADKFFNSLIPQEQTWTERILLRLVRPGIGQDYVANRIKKESLYRIGPQENVDRVLNKLIAEHLVRVTESNLGADSEVEVAHEALIRNWQHLVSLLDAERERMTTLRRLELKAGEWVRLGRGTAGLLRDAALVEAEQWLANPDADVVGPSDNVRQLVSASRAAANAARRLRFLAVLALAVTTAMSVAIAIWAIRQWHRANDQSTLATEKSKLATQQSELATEKSKLATEQSELAEARRLQVEELVKKLRKALGKSEADARLYDADKLGDDAEDAVADDPERAVLFAIRSSMLLSAHKQALPPSIETAVYKAAQSNRLRMQLPSSYHVTGMTFSPDGSDLATTEAGQPIRLWDASTGKLLLTFSHSNNGSALAFSLDNRQFAAAFDNKIRIFDARTGQLQKTMNSKISAIWHLLFSPDGSYLVVSGFGGSPEVWRLDSESGPMVLKSLHGLSPQVSSVAVSPTGSLILTGDEQSIKLWDAQSGDLLREFANHDGDITSLVFHPDGIHFASASDDGSIRFWALTSVPVTAVTASYKFGLSMSAPMRGGDVVGIAFSADGLRFTSIAEDGTVSIWNVDTGRAADQFPVRPVSQAAFNLDGSKLAANLEGSPLAIWDVSPGLGQVIGSHNGPISDLTESQGNRVLTISTADGMVRTWDLSKPGHEFEFEEKLTTLSAGFGSETAIAITQNFEHALVGTNKGIAYRSNRDEQDRPLTPTLGSPISAVALTADGKIGAVVTNDGSIYSGDLDALQLKQLPIKFKVNDIAFSHDGSYLATAGEDRTVKLWRWNRLSADAALILHGHAGAVNSITFSHDDKMLASCSNDGVVKIWSIAGPDSGANILSFNTGSAVASRIRFVQNDTGLLVAGKDGVLRMFPLMMHNELPHLLAAVSRDFHSGECQGDCSDLRSFAQNMTEANRLARLGDTAQASATLELAEKSIPGLTINGQEEIRLVQQKVAEERERQATRGTIAEATALARAQLKQKATDLMTQLAKHDASLINPDDLSAHAKAATVAVFRALVPDLAENGDDDLLQTLFYRIQSLAPSAIQGKADPELELRDFMADAYFKAAQAAVNNQKAIEKVLGLFGKAKQYSQKPIFLTQLITNDWFNKELCKKAAGDIGGFVHDPKIPAACDAAAQSYVNLTSHQLEQALDSIKIARKYATSALSLDANTSFNNELCWQGSISDGTFFNNLEIVAACNRAVALSQNNPAVLDSRGVNRARNGDPHAKEDFGPYANDPKTPQDRRETRQAWINLLQKGQNPFTPDVLKQLRGNW